MFPTLLLFVLSGFSGTAALAQEPQVTGDQDGSSQQVEETDEAYRRRMELEDARRRDPTYTDPADAYRRELEKIDKLPKESRENIRDQLVDIIMQEGEWKPADTLKDYPYEPTAAAQADSELMQQEQEAWAEQIEKYHAREAAAFGAYRGPVEGPGNPDGSEGGEAGQGGQQGSQGGQGQQGSDGQAGTYQPYQPQDSDRENAVSTDGVSESALDFLMQRQSGQPGGQQSPGQAAAQQGQQPPSESPSQAAEQATAQQEAAQQSSEQQSRTSEEQAETSEDPEQVTEPDMRGIIAIEDLDKLEGTGGVPVALPEEDEDEEDDP